MPSFAKTVFSYYSAMPATFISSLPIFTPTLPSSSSFCSAALQARRRVIQHEVKCCAILLNSFARLQHQGLPNKSMPPSLSPTAWCMQSEQSGHTGI